MNLSKVKKFVNIIPFERTYDERTKYTIQGFIIPRLVILTKSYIYSGSIICLKIYFLLCFSDYYT